MFLVFLLSLVLAVSLAAGQAAAAAVCPADGDPNITSLLEPILQEHKVPALCAAVINSRGLVAKGAVGIRRADTAIAVTVGDLWHLGSDTKAMTATLIGRLVEQDKLRWDSTLGEIFDELAPEMHPGLKNVTVLQLLSHQAGLEENYLWPLHSLKGTPSQQRYGVVKKAVSNKPKYPVASGTHYSNLGYVVAGAAVEKITGSTWEEQIRQLVFEPLKMTTVGFGGVGTVGKIDQPWPHKENGKPVLSNGPQMDNPLLIAPAGCVHCSIEDWARFVADQLNGAMGKPGLLKPETYKTIQTPPFGGDYALGWVVTQRDWGGGTVFNHGGSNTMNFANVWIAPNRDFAAIVCTNQGGDEAFAATDDAASALIGAYIKQQ